MKWRSNRKHITLKNESVLFMFNNEIKMIRKLKVNLLFHTKIFSSKFQKIVFFLIFHSI